MALAPWQWETEEERKARDDQRFNDLVQVDISRWEEEDKAEETAFRQRAQVDMDFWEEERQGEIAAQEEESRQNRDFQAMAQADMDSWQESEDQKFQEMAQADMADYTTDWMGANQRQAASYTPTDEEARGQEYRVPSFEGTGLDYGQGPNILEQMRIPSVTGVSEPPPADTLIPQVESRLRSGLGKAGRWLGEAELEGLKGTGRDVLNIGRLLLPERFPIQPEPGASEEEWQNYEVRQRRAAEGAALGVGLGAGTIRIPGKALPPGKIVLRGGVDIPSPEILEEQMARAKAMLKPRMPVAERADIQKAIWELDAQGEIGEIMRHYEPDAALKHIERRSRDLEDLATARSMPTGNARLASSRPELAAEFRGVTGKEIAAKLDVYGQFLDDARFEPVEAATRQALPEQPDLFGVTKGRFKAEGEAPMAQMEMGIGAGERPIEELPLFKAGREAPPREPPPPPSTLPLDLEEAGGIRIPRERGLTERLRTTEHLVSPEVRQRLDDTIETYEQLGNRVAAKEAAERIATDPAASRARVLDLQHPPDPVSISEGIQLFKQAEQAGNVDEADLLIRALAKKGTARGQEVQMFSTIDKMSPEGVFLEAHRTIQKYIATGGEKAIPGLEKRLAEVERGARAPGIKQEAAALREQAAKGGQRARDLEYLIDDTVREVRAQLTDAERQAIIKAKAILKQSGAEMSRDMANSFLDRAAALKGLSGEARVRGIMDLIEEVRQMPEVIAAQTQGRTLRPVALLAQQAADLTQLIDRTARNVFQQLNSADRLAVAAVKAVLKRTDVELPKGMAESLLVRAREIRGLPVAEQAGALKKLVAEVRSYDPVAKELARTKAIADAEARARAIARQHANDLAALIDVSARKAPGAVSSAERAAIGQAKAILGKYGAALPEDMARDFLERAKALEGLAPEAQVGARKALVQEIKDFDPVRLGKEAQDAAREQARLLRKRASDLEILTGRKVPEVVQRLPSYERQAVGQARQRVVKEGLALPEALANNLLDRAREVQGMAPGLQQARRYEALMQDIKNLVPPSGWSTAMDVLNIPRAIRSAWDLSYMLRQGWRTLVTHPLIWANTWKPMLQGVFDPAEATRIMDAIATRPMANIAHWAGLEFLEFQTTLAKGEEFFSNRLLGRVPGYKASERGFVIPGNKMRADMFDNTIKNWFPKDADLSQIKSLEEAATLSGHSTKDFEDLARVYNALTGRGSVKWLRTNSTLLAPLFWSTRLMVSQIEPYYMLAAGPFGRGATTPAARKELARMIVGQWGAFAATAALGSQAGIWETDPDPRGTHLGQVRFKGTNTWIDLTGGAGPYVRFLAQVSSGTAKTGSGEIVPVDRSDTAVRFMGSKFAPIPGAIKNFAEGVNYVGDRRDIANPSHLLLGLRDLFAPLSATDIAEGFMEDKLRGGLLSATQLVGLGAQTYRSLTDIRDQATRAGNFIRAGQKVERYQDLNEGQQKVVDETRAVQGARGETRGLEPTTQEQLRVLMPQYDRRKAELESNPDPNSPGLRQRIDAGLTGKALKEAIQDFKQNRFEASKAILGAPNIQAFLERNAGKQQVDDVLADAYWSAHLPEDLATGELDFTARDRVRAQVLAQADALGVRRDYITGTGAGTYRGQRFADPVVRRKVEEYEDDTEKLRAYWDVDDKTFTTLKGKYPTLAPYRSYQELQAARSPQGQAIAAEVARIVGGQREVLRAQRPDLDRLLLKWGYVSKPIAARR